MEAEPAARFNADCILCGEYWFTSCLHCVLISEECQQKPAVALVDTQPQTSPINILSSQGEWAVAIAVCIAVL